MPNEQKHKTPLNLEEIARIAKETTLHDGYHIPVVIADGRRQSVVVHVENFASTHEQRAQQLWALGAMLAEHGELGALQQVFLITEAWLSIGTPDNPPITPPSQNPQRKEVLSISRYVLQPPLTEMVVFEMKRNKVGKLTNIDDLDKPFTEGQEIKVDSPLLKALAIGYLGSARKQSH